MSRRSKSIAKQTGCVSNTPPFSFFLETTRHRVDRHGSLWKKPLPLAPRLEAVASSGDGSGAISYGDYFNAVSRFLTWDGCSRLYHARMQQFAESPDADAIQRVRVFLIKHGEFYHPSRIELDFGLRRRCFVLNVAVSEAGRDCLGEEYRCLDRLGSHPEAGLIPRAYAQGTVRSPNHPDLKMWLGEWFEGFHEFHWSFNEGKSEPTLALWDPPAPVRYLNSRQTAAIYCQAAALLTHFYDLTSFEQIHPWHHGAGDFIVRQRDDDIDIRLITVRGYPCLLTAPPSKSEFPPDAGLILQILLLFLVRLSLRMRIDRLDGVGELFWADGAVVKHSVAGFLTALVQKPQPPQLPDSPLRCFDYFFSQCSEADLEEITAAVVAAYPPDHPEKKLLKHNAAVHAGQLFTALNSYLKTRD